MRRGIPVHLGHRGRDLEGVVQVSLVQRLRVGIIAFHAAGAIRRAELAGGIGAGLADLLSTVPSERLNEWQCC
jgi:hypothetical protein